VSPTAVDPSIHRVVYDLDVTRTNLDIDDELVTEVMRRYGISTKRAAVDLALRRLVGDAMSRDEALGMEGSGWYADLGELRRSTPVALG
jgi:Arc/MetJ family transcription regulator